MLVLLPLPMISIHQVSVAEVIWRRLTPGSGGLLRVFVCCKHQEAVSASPPSKLESGRDMKDHRFTPPPFSPISVLLPSAFQQTLPRIQEPSASLYLPSASTILLVTGLNADHQAEKSDVEECLMPSALEKSNQAINPMEFAWDYFPGRTWVGFS